MDRFAPAIALRRSFDRRFADPRRADQARFVWDYWHVPGQYTALRTPAWTYFERRLYEPLHRKLVHWGRATLGCHDISPPWLSLYVEGCRQELHGDLPHGPWAFVYSLTRWRGRRFRGGETLLVRDDVLDYWHDFRSTRSIEHDELIRAIAPQFGRLVVFDPRIPHGVRQVTGTHDPREGRLVIHGWFVQPRPFVSGPLASRALASKLDDLIAAIGHQIGALAVAGMVSFAFVVDRRGAVRKLRLLSDTTRVARSDDGHRARLVTGLRHQIASWRFPPQRAASQVTLPVVFER